MTTSYAYSPYGATTVSGVPSTNTYPYTGRGQDTTGLNYNRARDYHPQWGRFLSRDPIGFRGGVNP